MNLSPCGEKELKHIPAWLTIQLHKQKVHDLPQDSERVTPNTGESQSATAKNELSKIDPDTY